MRPGNSNSDILVSAAGGLYPTELRALRNQIVLAHADYLLPLGRAAKEEFFKRVCGIENLLRHPTSRNNFKSGLLLILHAGIKCIRSILGI